MTQPMDPNRQWRLRALLEALDDVNQAGLSDGFMPADLSGVVTDDLRELLAPLGFDESLKVLTDNDWQGIDDEIRGRRDADIDDEPSPWDLDDDEQRVVDRLRSWNHKSGSQTFSTEEMFALLGMTTQLMMSSEAAKKFARAVKLMREARNAKLAALTPS